ncbi:MAG: repeat containing protein, partial [Cyanobacteria bacterium RYN_339]|nr:repeat containing protein [Cyanobacteria bacterium RYN_339]
TGAFTLKALPKDQNLVVHVINVKPGFRLGAIAPKGAQTKLAIDLVSTVSASYILNKFVKVQPDASAALDRLPADVAAKTVEATAAALGTPDAERAKALLQGSATQPIDALRLTSVALNAQLDAVARIIGIGVGTKAIDPNPLANSFSSIRSLACGTDGALYIALMHDDRVVRLREGRLEAVNDPAAAKTGALTGQRLPQAGIMGPIDVEPDAQDRLVVLDYPRAGFSESTPPRFRLTRLPLAGPAEDLWADIGLTLAAWPEAGDEVRVLAGGDRPGGKPAMLWSLLPGQAPKALFTFEVQDPALGPDAQQNHYLGYKADGPPRVVGHDARGSLFVGASRAELRRAKVAKEDQVDTVYRYLEAGRAREAFKVTGKDDVESLVLTPHGEVLAIVSNPTSRKLVLYAAAGERTLAATLPQDFTLDPLAPAAVGPAGDAYVVRRNSTVWHVGTDGAITHVAGLDPTTSQATTNLSFLQPAGITVAPGGELYVSDKDGNRIYKVGADGKVAIWAGTGGDKGTGDGGPVAAAAVRAPRALRQDKDGNIYILSSNTAVRKVDKAGVITTLLSKLEGDRTIRDLVVSPDGVLTFSTKATVIPTDPASGKVGVARWHPDGTLTWLVPESNAPGHVIGSDPAGTVYVLSADGDRRALGRIKDDKLEPILEDPRLAITFPEDNNAIAVDGNNHLYLTLVESDQIWKVDLSSKQVSQVAGEGAPLLAGTGLDDSLSGPRYPTFGPAGDLFVADKWHRQVKRIPARSLP